MLAHQLLRDEGILLRVGVRIKSLAPGAEGDGVEVHMQIGLAIQPLPFQAGRAQRLALVRHRNLAGGEPVRAGSDDGNIRTVLVYPTRCNFAFGVDDGFVLPQPLAAVRKHLREETVHVHNGDT